MNRDLEDTRRKLIAKRFTAGADTPDGHACSSLVEQTEHLPGDKPTPKGRASVGVYDEIWFRTYPNGLTLQQTPGA